MPQRIAARKTQVGRELSEILGAAVGLATVISGHNNYFYWGPGNTGGSVVITLGNDVAPLMRDYQSVTPAGRASESAPPNCGTPPSKLSVPSISVVSG